MDFGLEIGSDLVNPNIIAVHTKTGQRVKSIWTDTLIIADWQDIGVEILAEVLKDQYREWPEDKNIISNINKILNP